MAIICVFFIFIANVRAVTVKLKLDYTRWKFRSAVEIRRRFEFSNSRGKFLCALLLKVEIRLC